ncbi:hypothetical protein E4U42_001594 [Claviceps africana]|uniref:CFEM domain-containing protein n=1 Tax=Claviceps africana TaxID=83212 RepID=A0A8K0JF62_9HYPO|nr:hypothetical protein E4U42_001594 [Claviceps africana]
MLFPDDTSIAPVRPMDHASPKALSCETLVCHVTSSSTVSNSIFKMKSVVVALSLVAAAAAQDVNALAQCGQICANNMMAAAKAEELGCKANDLKCLCSNANFMYGLRDCSHAVCSQQDANQVVAYGLKVCEGAGVAVTGGHAGASQSGAGAGASQSGSGAGAGASQTGAATGTGAGAGPGSGHGDAHVTIISGPVTGTDGKVMTVPIATSTITGSVPGGIAGGAHSGSAHATTGTGPAATATDGGHTQSTLMTQPTHSGTEGTGATATGTATGGEPTGAQTPSAAPTTTSTSTGFAAHITAAPGLLAAAGLAALLL